MTERYAHLAPDHLNDAVANLRLSAHFQRTEKAKTTVLYQAELHPDCIPTNFRSLGFPIVTLACVYFTFYCATSVPTLSLKGVTSNEQGPILMPS